MDDAQRKLTPDQGRRRALSAIGGLFGLAALAGCGSSRTKRARAEWEDRAPVGSLTDRDDRPYRPQNPEPVWEGTAARGVIARSAWAHEQPRPWLADPMGRISRITIHHDGYDVFGSPHQTDAAERLELFRDRHIKLGWADIGYHYAVDPAGRVYECRPVSLQGAHVKHNNEQNLGILVLGHHSLQAPTDEALGALARFVRAKQTEYRVPASRVYTHRELRPTECPGHNLQRRFDEIRRRGMIA
ncbi:MAG: peptidoglycan recognition family protein [Planctomycetota bacterium]